MAENCCSTGGVTLIYTCSGTSDVGELSDRVVRKLWNEGFAGRNCLAGIGADISGFVKSAQGVEKNITIDGCPVACARKTLERIGVKPVSIMLGDLGYKKGESPVTDESIEKVCDSIKNITKMETAAPTSGCGCCS